MPNHNKGVKEMLERKKAQSILEYVIVLTAIVVAIIVGVSMLTSHNADRGLGKLMHGAGDRIANESQRISGMIK